MVPVFSIYLVVLGKLRLSNLFSVFSEKVLIKASL